MELLDANNNVMEDDDPWACSSALFAELPPPRPCTPDIDPNDYDPFYCEEQLAEQRIEYTPVEAAQDDRHTNESNHPESRREQIHVVEVK